MTELDTTEPGTDLATIRTNLPEVPEALAEAYPALSADIDLVEIMDGALGEGKTLRVSQLTRIKVPNIDSGTSLMLPDDNGDKMPVRDGVTGIPVAISQRRSFWVSETVNDSPPDCSSRDLVHGVGMYGEGSTDNPTGLCVECPMNARGSANKGTMAAKCKEQRLVFLLTDREAFPLVFVFPPGSLQNFDAHGAMLTKKLIKGPERPELGTNPRTGKVWRASPWLRYEVNLSLEQDTNRAGQRYNKLVVKPVRKLGDDEAAIVNMYGRTIDDMIADEAEAMDVLANEAASDTTGTRETGKPGRNGSGAADDLDDPNVDLGDLEDEIAGSNSR